jgi:xanthine dehydrogenase accessory factor
MSPELLAEILRRVTAKRPVVVATDLGSGSESLVDPFDASEPVAPDLLREVREAALRDESRRVERPGGALFLRPYNPPVRVIVVGAVHVAQALVPMTQQVGYDVVVIDPRRAFATPERFPGVTLSGEWPDAALASIGIDRRTAVVTITHDPKLDDPALAAALRSEAFYVGALGSRKTQAARRERLRLMGLGDRDLARIHGPVGLAIGAVSPGEIAVSILAEIIAALRTRSADAPSGP